jgi:hypothetical protein
MTIGAHKRYTTYPAKFDNLVVPDVLNVSPSSAVQKMILMPGGSINPALVAEVSQDPSATITALDLKTMLTQCGLAGGLYCSSSVLLQYQQRALGGIFMAGSNHVRITAPAGILYIENIRAQQDEQNAAAVAMKFQAFGNTNTRPMTVATGQSLLGTPSIARAYKLGPVSFEGTVLGGVQSSQVATGLSCQTKRADGRTWAVTGSLVKAGPTGEISLDTLDLAATVGMGTMPISVGTDVYFQQVGFGPADAAHIRVRFTSGLYEISEMPASGEGDASTKLVITGGADQAVSISFAVDVTLP